MATASLAVGGRTLAVTQAKISLGINGSWTALLALDAGKLPAGTATLTLQEPDQQIVGSLVPSRSGIFAGMMGTMMVGGAGLNGTAQPKAYNGASVPVTIRSVVTDLLAAASVALSPAADAGVLATTMPAWAVVARPIARQLSFLLEAVAPAGSGWRVLEDGTVWVGPQPSTDYAGTYEVIHRQPQEGQIEMASLSRWMAPGDVIAEGQVSDLLYVYDPESVRVMAWLV